MEKEDIVKFTEKMPALIIETRKEYGRYFGICGSYHHLKACICRRCLSYSGGTGMFCSRKNKQEQGKKEGCLCEFCELFKKFRFEGDYFCRKGEKEDLSEKSRTSLNNYKNTSSSNGETRFCVLEKLEYMSK